jgi:tRNA(Ser,Leu) C12 N-acetylase TAN1
MDCGVSTKGGRPAHMPCKSKKFLLVFDMVEADPSKIVKLIITSRGLEPVRYFRSALKRAVPGARVRSTGYRGIFVLEAEAAVFELAELVCRECTQSIGHVTAVLAMVESKEQPIKDAAVRIGSEQIGPDESFCFRLHKRGVHGLQQDTSKIEQEIGGAIWTALERKHNKKPKVDLKSPDITVIAEILGPIAGVGVSRKSWRV